MSEFSEVILTLVDERRHKAGQKAEMAKRNHGCDSPPYIAWQAVEEEMYDLRKEIDEVAREFEVKV